QRNIRSGQVEVRMIERIRRRRGECESESLRNGERLGDGNVLVVVAGAFQHVRTGVAQRAGRRWSEATGVKPARHSALIRRQVSIAQTVRKTTQRVRIGRV